VAKKMKWVQITDNIANMTFDLCWTDSHVKQEIFYKMHQGQKINHFPGMEILSRKNNLGNALMAFRTRFPEDYDFFPNTWMLPADFQELKEYHDTRQSGKAQTFIVKPEANCQGRGIFLTRNIDSNFKSIQSSKGRGAWCRDICISPF
jgi:tubulin polyglutamylase TTLL6/13